MSEPMVLHEPHRRTAVSMVRMAALVVLTYALYLGAHVLQGSPVPDGAVFATVIGAVGALWGAQVGARYL
jgi:hypothetical protein